MSNNRKDKKTFCILLAIAILLILGGMALFMSIGFIAVGLEDPSKIKDYIYLPIIGAFVFIVGGLLLAFAMYLKMRGVWDAFGGQVHLYKAPKKENGGKKCPRCESLNDEDALYCKKCGERLP